MITRVLVLGCVFAVSVIFWSGVVSAEGALPVAVVTGGHGYEKEPFEAMFKRFEGLECVFVELEDQSEIFEDISDWPYKAVVLYNMTRDISEKRQENLIKLLEQGVGVVVLHHAIAAFPDWPEYRKIAGAKYWLEDTVENGVTHPKSQWEEGVDMHLHVEDTSHPIMAGVSDFTVHDETYKGYDLEPDNHLILSCSEPGSQKEVAWTRTYRNAKICLIQPGHGSGAYENENFRRILHQAIQWVAMK